MRPRPKSRGNEADQLADRLADVGFNEAAAEEPRKWPRNACTVRICRTLQ